MPPAPSSRWGGTSTGGAGAAGVAAMTIPPAALCRFGRGPARGSAGGRPTRRGSRGAQHLPHLHISSRGFTQEIHGQVQQFPRRSTATRARIRHRKRRSGTPNPQRRTSRSCRVPFTPERGAGPTGAAPVALSAAPDAAPKGKTQAGLSRWHQAEDRVAAAAHMGGDDRTGGWSSPPRRGRECLLGAEVQRPSSGRAGGDHQDAPVGFFFLARRLTCPACRLTLHLPWRWPEETSVQQRPAAAPSHSRPDGAVAARPAHHTTEVPAILPCTSHLGFVLGEVYRESLAVH